MMSSSAPPQLSGARPASVKRTLRDAWKLRRVWWFTATARTQARFVRTLLGSFWLGLSNLFSIAVLASVYRYVFKVDDFGQYVVLLGLGLVIWNSIGAAVIDAPNLFEHNQSHVHNTNMNPIFYPLEEWAFQMQTFVQSFLMVVIALSYFQHTLLLHLVVSGWLPVFNLFLFLFWFPLLICLVGARFRDLYQLVPIAMQLVFLLSPILYRKENLGPSVWIANFNPFYRVLSPIRHALMTGQLQWGVGLALLLINVIGVWYAVRRLNHERPNLPFLI
jgi:lipopolysaccharide transport system permease protein